MVSNTDRKPTTIRTADKWDSRGESVTASGLVCTGLARTSIQRVPEYVTAARGTSGCARDPAARVDALTNSRHVSGLKQA